MSSSKGTNYNTHWLRHTNPVNRARKSSVYPDYIHNPRMRFQLCIAATATILHRFSISMCQNLRENQSFKSYFLSQAVKSTVWPVDELKQKHRDLTHLTRHFPLYKDTFSKFPSSADSKERDRQCPRTIKVTQSPTTKQATRLPSTGPTMSRISTTSYIGKSGWWSELAETTAT